ncbi:unnamed protein product [Urochloa decumbens]|uniref:Uncharacterized protein n=1 Tax=Urochloa decumbens TaxID=240449 RepID=A0ABC9B9T7_9POAL
MIAADEPLLHDPLQADRGGGFSWLTALGFAFLTFNSGMAIYRSKGDAGAVAFVVFSYVDLFLLFNCLRWYERTHPASPRRKNLKVAIWTLTTLLTISFTYKLAVSLPVLVQILVWAMAGATVLGGFYAFFLHEERKGDDVDAAVPNERVKMVLSVVLAPLRWRLPQTAGDVRAQDPRDIALSATRFIVDSGATSHAVGNPLLLEGFQPYIPPRLATQADGTNLHILGIGRVQRGYFNIPNVSLVEGLVDGLISTYQLDSEHGLNTNFSDNGVCRITQADGNQVGGAIFDTQRGGYVLRYLDVPGPAQQ